MAKESETEKIRKMLLEEEFKLRSKQPAAWTKIKYRKHVKLPKEFLKKSRKKKSPAEKAKKRKKK